MVALKNIIVSLAAAGLVSADGLDARAKAAGKKYWGSAVSTTILNDASANTIVKNLQDFGSYTCENEMKFDATEPSRGTFSYTNADRIVAQAQASGQIMRCHTLVWHSQVPSWVANGGFNNATLISIMKNHIANVAGHYKGTQLQYPRYFCVSGNLLNMDRQVLRLGRRQRGPERRRQLPQLRQHLVPHHRPSFYPHRLRCRSRG
jgi:GH35 family endo-1,4-beta-xylanase